MSHPSHAVFFDLDGTLVDSVYQHVRIWRDVLKEHGFVVPHWKVHQGIGLPTERLLPWLLGALPTSVSAMSEAHDARMLDQAATLSATDGALDLLSDLDARGVPYYAVTSAGDQILAALFAALGREIPVASAGAKGGSKPDAAPITSALRDLKLEPGEVTMVGDAVWDGESARRAGVHFIAVRCGGTSDDRLLQAGALWVEDAPRALVGRL